MEFGKELNTLEKLMPEVKNPQKILFDVDFTDPIEKQIQNELKDKSKFF